MGLFDGYAPQNFSDRGGLYGRLLSLRPDLALDQQGDDEPAQGQPIQAPGRQPKPISMPEPAASAIGSALADFYRQTILQPAKDIAGYVNDAVNDPAYFAHAAGPSLAGFAPFASQLPAAVNAATGATRALGELARRNSDSTKDSVEPIQSPGSNVKLPKEVDGSAAPGIPTATVPGPANVNIGSVGSSASSGFRPVQFAPASAMSSTSQWPGTPIAGSALLPVLGLAASIASRRSSELLGAPPPRWAFRYQI